MKPDRAVAGALVALLGAALALLVWFEPQRLPAPAPLAYLTGLVLVLAGWLVVAQAGAHPRLKAWLPVALLACLVAPAVWLALAPGHVGCVIGSGGLLELLGITSDMACRSAFGAAAAVGVALVLLALRQALRASRAR